MRFISANSAASRSAAARALLGTTHGSAPTVLLLVEREAHALLTSVSLELIV